MVAKVMRILSVGALAVMIGGAFYQVGIEQALATGTNAVAEMSAGADLVGQTIQSTEVLGNWGWLMIALLGAGIMFLHNGGGFFGLLVGLIGVGFWFNGQRLAETFGWTAVGM